MLKLFLISVLSLLGTQPAIHNSPQIKGERFALANSKPVEEITGNLADKIEPPLKTDQNSLGIKLESASAIVLDQVTEEVIFAKNEDNGFPLASLAKLAAILTFLKLDPDLEQIVTMQNSDFYKGDKRHIYQGERIKIQDLISIGLIASDNNAVRALIRSSGLSLEQFIIEMNLLAQENNLDKTYFSDIIGLSLETKSTAYETALLSRIAFADSLIRQIVSQKEYTFFIQNNLKKRTIKNTNSLLSNKIISVNCGKTGTLYKQYNLAIEAESEQGNKIIVVILGAPSNELRFQEAKSLAWWTFSRFKW